MIRNVVRTFHWEPAVISRLFLDAEDYQGLEFWSNDAEEMHKELEK